MFLTSTSVTPLQFGQRSRKVKNVKVQKLFLSIVSNAGTPIYLKQKQEVKVI